MIYVDTADVINTVCKSRVYSEHIYIKEYSELFSDWSQSKLTICAYHVSHNIPAMSIAMRHYTNLIDVSQLST